MTISFTKMHGTGNDFILINDYQKKNIKSTSYNNLAKELCQRHFNVGADGMILVLPPEKSMADFKMRIFNSDGSEAEMCGNGIRCFSHFLHLERLTEKEKLKIETLAGIIKPEILEGKENKKQVKVNMGKPLFQPSEIPINIEDKKRIYNYPLSIDKREFKINCVSMGNPHTVIFGEDPTTLNISEVGKKIEQHELFPEKTNVEFIEIINSSEINMKVWERGSGITLACGTGACAAVAAGIKNGLLEKNVTVHLPGGDLQIQWASEEENIYMTGPSQFVYEGKIPE